MPQLSIKKNFAYKSILTLSTYLIGLVTFPYISRVLGVEGVGLVSFVDNTVNYFLLFATMGIGMLGIREIAAVKEDPKTHSRIFSRILGLNLLFTGAILIIYLILITSIPTLRDNKELFYIGSAKIVFTAFMVEWFFTGIENFKYITLRSIIIKILYVLAVFLFVRRADDYRLYFILTTSTVAINALINIVYAHSYVHLRLSEMVRVKQYIRQNFTLGIYSIMTSMYLTFNVMFLGFISDNTQVGYYTTAFKLYTVILGFFTAFTSVMLPRMSALLAEGKEDRFHELINKSFSAMLTVCIPLIMCSIILAPQIIYVISGPGYEGAILPMQIIMPAVLFVGIAQILAIQILMPMKKDRILLFASIIGAAISLLINILLVPRLQSIGTAVVLLSAEAIVTTTYVLYVVRHRLTPMPVRAIGQHVLYSLPSAVACLACGYWIANPFVALTVATMSAIGSWLAIHLLCRTNTGNIILNYTLRKHG